MHDGFSWNAYTKKCCTDKDGNGGTDDCSYTRRRTIDDDHKVPW